MVDSKIMRLLLAVVMAICLVFLTPSTFAEPEPHRETWVNLRGEEVSVFSTSVEPLVVRGYFEQKSIDDVTYSSQIDLKNIVYIDEYKSLVFYLPEFSDTSLILFTIPRDVLDSKWGYGREEDTDEDFIVLVSKDEIPDSLEYAEIYHKEIPSSNPDSRILLITLEPGDTYLEIIGSGWD